MLQMVPLLRPELLRGNPALGAASTRDAGWSEIGHCSASDPETEDALGALPSSAPDQQVQKKMKKRVVIRGNTPRETEAPCPYSHPAYAARDVD